MNGDLTAAGLSDPLFCHAVSLSENIEKCFLKSALADQHAEDSRVGKTAERVPGIGGQIGGNQDRCR